MFKHKQSTLALICLIFCGAFIFARPLFHGRPPVTTGRIAEGDRTFGSDSRMLTVHYHQRRPYYMKDAGRVHGLCADVVNRAFTNAGIPYRWQETPAKRQLPLLEANRKRECLVGWFKNPSREAYAKFSIPIYRDKPTIALARKDNPRINSGDSLEKIFADHLLKLLRKDGYAYGEFIDRKIAAFNPRQVVTTADNMGMLQMIRSWRADYFFIAEEEAASLVSLSGLPSATFKFISFSHMPEGNRRYILYSRKVEDSIIEKIDDAVRAIHGARPKEG